MSQPQQIVKSSSNEHNKCVKFTKLLRIFTVKWTQNWISEQTAFFHIQTLKHLSAYVKVKMNEWMNWVK